MKHTSTSNVLNFPSVQDRISPECRLHIEALPSIEYDEEAFNRLLALERKRSERSKRPFMVMLLSLAKVLAGDGANNTCEKILSCLAASKRDTDVLGWYRSGLVIGIILTELSEPCEGDATKSILERVRSNLSLNIDPEIMKKIEVSFYLFPDKLNSDGISTLLTLYPDISKGLNSHKGSLFLKRMIDFTGSLVALVISAPLFLVVSALIKLTSQGPVLFRQTRVGQYGKTFTLLKFRSMVVGNDPSIHKEYTRKLIKASDQSRRNGDSNETDVFKIQKDPRVTLIGRFLRKTSLDELPQFINVLKGHMSLVGPRPPIPYEVEDYDLWHRRRVLEMKPGITGMWQVVGRSKTTFNEMVRLDIYYCTNWSIWLDLKLLLKTPLAVLRGGY